MRKKLLLRILAGVFAFSMLFALVACNDNPDDNTGGFTGGGYGNLEDFFNDFFDDWNGSSDKTHTQTDWSETYGEQANKADYIDGTGSQTFDPALGTHFYEAEYAQFESPARILYGSGSSGKLQVEYIEQGVVISLDVYSAKDCTVLLGMGLGCSAGNVLTTDLFAITYTDESGEHSGVVEVDDYYFSAGGWLAFKEQSIGEVPLKTGKNTIAVVSFGGFNLDYFVLTPQLSDVKERPVDSFTPTQKAEWESVFGTYKTKEYLRAEIVAEGFDPTWGAYKYEAEKAKMFGGATTQTVNTNASGYATVGFSSASIVDIEINSVADCEVLLKVAATTDSNYKNTALTSLMNVGIIGGDKATNKDNMISTGGLNNQPVENSLGTVRLKNGRNILRIEPLSHGTFEIDYISLLPVKANIVGNPQYDPNAGYVVPFDDWGTVYGKYSKGSYVSCKTNPFDPQNGAHIYEAEDGVLGSGLKVEDKTNASGKKQVAGYDEKSHTITFTIQSTCQYTALISLGYTSAPGFAQHLTADNFIKITYGDGKVVKCSDSRITAGDWTDDGIYVESYIGEITLEEGTNTITLDCFNMKYPNTICLDYMLLSPKQEDAAGYTVTYDFDGGEGDPIDVIKYKTGSTFTVAYGTDIKKVGFVFGGWTDGQNTYQGGETYVMPDRAVTFTALWIDADLHTVTYELDGGSGSQQSETRYAGEVFALPDGAKLSKEGYTFGGWTDGSNCYSVGASMEMPDADITLTAIWLPARSNWDNVYGPADPEKNYHKATANGGVFDYDLQGGTYLFEAEELALGKGLGVESNKVNASGNKQVSGFDSPTRTFTLTVNASHSGAVLLTLGYTGNPGMNTNRPASYYFTVYNGTFKLDCSQTKVIAGDWTKDVYVELRLGVIYLKEGLNTLEFSFANLPFSDCIALDYVLLTAGTNVKTVSNNYAGVTSDVNGESRIANYNLVLVDEVSKWLPQRRLVLCNSIVK